MRKRASVKDAQSEVRTKVPDSVYDEIEAYAAAHFITEYRAARELILIGLEAVRRGTAR